jgi:hypothetical protein
LLVIGKPTFAQESVAKSSERFDAVGRSLNVAADAQVAAVLAQLPSDGKPASRETPPAKPESGLDRSGPEGSVVHFESIGVDARRVLRDAGCPRNFSQSRRWRAT